MTKHPGVNDYAQEATHIWYLAYQLPTPLTHQLANSPTDKVNKEVDDEDDHSDGEGFP